jgi:hypothetical protein
MLMKNVKLLIPAFTLAAVSGLWLAAQQPQDSPAPDMPQPSALLSAGQQPGTPQQPTAGQTDPAQQSPPPAAAVPQTADAPEVNNAELRPVNGELVSKIDTKNAKAGDPVVVKTTEKATISSGVVIPKGSKITGHVIEVQAHDKTNENSKLTIQFDQAQLKDGQTMPIKSVLQSLSPAPGSDNAQSSPFGSGSAPSAPTASPSTGAPGGSAGNAGTATMPSQGSAASNPGSTAGSTAGMTPAPSGLPAAGTVVAHQGNIDIKTTAIPGVLIAANSNGQPFSNASGALLGARQNVHLDGGTQVTLAIADANNKASINR